MVIRRIMRNRAAIRIVMRYVSIGSEILFIVGSVLQYALTTMRGMAILAMNLHGQDARATLNGTVEG